ncbi:MAG: transglycosylase domain-containing protein [Sphingomonadaceae bacterium]|uniref:penicillin-binding protein 1A n=1 Tax=Thermaurantiacus sp. TaxID=2820283 RepID=UPI00298EF6E9|nr:transglycosylase domain-containing protein [Thermaurantiacus sp.]MCS6987748.1 transglycosylase domain-containing protein [Sphingomonadaceae bacterium]MDW8415032.1 transglycosylase domain-containing protein [Thermaurantiacus sp.]
MDAKTPQADAELAPPPWRRALRRLAIPVVVVGLMAAVAAGLLWALVLRGLPDARQLAAYQPPLPTQVRDSAGNPLFSFARERRVYLPLEEIPPLVVHAFLSAEDRTFFEHGGLDYPGIVAAILTNLKGLFTKQGRPVGASTITQQVAKNLLLSSEVTLRRKLKEAVLARRIEDVLTKEQILEIYLNEIFLGRNAYGVEAAAQAYFGKSVADLRPHEAALLASLPKAPSTFDPRRNPARALERRNWVLSEMVRNGHLPARELAFWQGQPLGTVASRPVANRPPYGADFFEEVRRQLIERFGETAGDGPHSLYAGGLWVRTTIDPVLQRAAEKALRDGLVRYDRARGWRGPAGTIALGPGWAERLRALDLPVGYATWRAAVVLAREDGRFRLGFADGTIGLMFAGDASLARGGVPAHQLLRPGDVIPVAPSGAGTWSLRQIPLVSGALVVQEVRTGRVLAMVGGFDNRGTGFNRATQALRQPGSTFKPFVYAAGLEGGLTPASLVSDGTLCVYQSARLGRKCFRNFGGRSAGLQTMRWGLEQSRNLMTVRIAAQTGMDRVVRLARDLDLGTYPPVLAIALGAGETTLLKIVNAFSILANGGRAVEPVVFDLVQDRQGRILFQADTRRCPACRAATYSGQDMPRPEAAPRQVMDAATAFQVVHMLEGVIERGTAERLRTLGVPIMGKTGTTTGPKDVWFVGGTPEVMAGLYIGFDRPRNLGGWVQGGNVAVPIWRDWFLEAYRDQRPEPTPFLAPRGIRMVRIDRRSGRRVFGTFPDDRGKAAVIWEAFRPETEPRRIVAPPPPRPLGPTGGRVRVRTDSDFLREQGGIY